MKAKTPKRLWKRLENRERALEKAAWEYTKANKLTAFNRLSRPRFYREHARAAASSRALKQAAIEYFRALTACATVTARKVVGGSKR